MTGSGLARSFSTIVLSCSALLALSACTAADPVTEPSSPPTANFAWQQAQLQEKADELWNAVNRQFPDAPAHLTAPRIC